MAKVKAQSSVKPRRKEMRPPAVIRTEGCQILHGDVVNVALQPDGMALTVYQTVPDPAEETRKGPVRYARAVITIPLGVAAQLPTIITGHLLKMADADAMLAEVSAPMVQELGKVVAHFQAKLQEKEG